MYEMTVTYLGKTYTFRGDSCACADRLEREFGRIVDRSYGEIDAYYRTVRGAVAHLI